MEHLKKPGRRLKKIAGSLGIIQATTWIILALIYMVLYFSYDGRNRYVINTDSNGLLYAYLVDENNSFLFAGLLSPPVFLFFAFVYCIIDIVWLLISIYVFFKENRFGFITWGIVTVVICLADFIIVIFIGNDYNRCKSTGRDFILFDYVYICGNAILPALVVVAKGFVLWIINLIFAIMLFRMSRKLKNPAVSQIWLQTYLPEHNMLYSNNHIPSNSQNFNLNSPQHLSENNNITNFQNWSPNQMQQLPSNVPQIPIRAQNWRQSLIETNGHNLTPNQLQIPSNHYRRPNSVPSQSWRHVQPNNGDLITNSLQEVFQHRQNRASAERVQRAPRQNFVQQHLMQERPSRY